jgi:hypothetical protein
MNYTVQLDQAAKLEFQCYFCGNKITSDRPDPIRMALFLEGDSVQELYIYLSCLRARLHSGVSLGFVEDSEAQT